MPRLLIIGVSITALAVAAAWFGTAVMAAPGHGGSWSGGGGGHWSGGGGGGGQHWSGGGSSAVVRTSPSIGSAPHPQFGGGGGSSVFRGESRSFGTGPMSPGFSGRGGSLFDRGGSFFDRGNRGDFEAQNRGFDFDRGRRHFRDFDDGPSFGFGIGVPWYDYGYSAPYAACPADATQCSYCDQAAAYGDWSYVARYCPWVPRPY